MSTQSDNVFRIIKAQTKGCTDTVIYLALGETVTDLCREVLQKPGPNNYKNFQDTWIDADEWLEYHNLLTMGTLYRLFSQPDKPYTNFELAKSFSETYQSLLKRARETSSPKELANTGYTRIMANLQFAVPAARDSALLQELFNTIDDFKRNVIQVAPPTHGTVPTSWMVSAEYGKYFRLLIAGTLSRMFRQSNKAWTDDKAAALNQQIYENEIAIVRGDAPGEPDTQINPSDRLMGNLRSKLPGVKDAMLYQELFNVIDDACRNGYVWVEAVNIELPLGAEFINITPPGTDIVRLQSANHPAIQDYTYDDAGRILLKEKVTPEVKKDLLVVVVALAPTIKSNADKPEEWIPDDLWGPCHQLFMHGTLSRMMLQSAKPYSNVSLGRHHGIEHRKYLLQAVRDVRASGVVPNPQMWNFPRFAK